MGMKKTALVTGASGVIGSAIAIMLAASGIDVILHYHQNYEGIKEVDEKCQKEGVKAWVIKADLADIKEINLMFDHIKNLDIVPNILVNAAGASHYGLIQDVTFENWQKLININMMSSFFCSQKVVSEMVRTGFGRIINISSIWGEKGAANEVIYSMTKGAINSFTKALAKELAPSGITVNAVAPGIVMSNMMGNFTNEELEELKTQIPMNRFAKAVEIAQSVLHFLHPNSSYITGQITNIDGGWTL